MSSSSTMEFTITSKLNFFVFCFFLKKNGVAWENFEMGLDLGFSFDRGSRLWGDMEGTDAPALDLATPIRRVNHHHPHRVNLTALD